MQYEQSERYKEMVLPKGGPEIGLMIAALAEQQNVLTNFYSEQYRKRMPHDSPDRSRTEMAKDVLRLLRRELLPNTQFLDIGSGPRALEKEIKAYANSSNTEKPQLFSIDRSIFSLNLLHDRKKDQRENPNAEFSAANALALPFADNTFGVVFSNHALDFIPRPTEQFLLPYAEAARVLAPGGYLVLNCHHPSMIDVDIKSIPDLAVRAHWGYLKENDILPSSEEQIRGILQALGLEAIEVGTQADTCDTWWRVIAQKPYKPDEATQPEYPSE